MSVQIVLTVDSERAFADLMKYVKENKEHISDQIAYCEIDSDNDLNTLPFLECMVIDGLLNEDNTTDAMIEVIVSQYTDMEQRIKDGDDSITYEDIKTVKKFLKRFNHEDVEKYVSDDEDTEDEEEDEDTEEELSPENIILREIPENGITLEELKNKLGNEIVVRYLGKCMKDKNIIKQGNLLVLNKNDV